MVILSHSMWMRSFDGDPSVIGRSVRFSGRTFRVVGVLPPRVQHVGGTYRTYGHGEPVDVWSVLAVPRDEHPRYRFSHFFNVVGRVRAGVSHAEMAEDLRRTGVSVAKRYPNPNSPWTPSAVPLKQEIVGTAESTLVDRTRQRGLDPSDADEAVVRVQHAQETGSIYWHRIDASRSPDRVLEEVQRLIAESCHSRRGRS